MRDRFVVAGLAASLFACGSPVSVSGSIGGASFNAVDAISDLVTGTEPLPDGGAITTYALSVVIGSSGGLCSMTEDNAEEKDSQALILILESNDANGLPTSPLPGTYVIESASNEVSLSSGSANAAVAGVDSFNDTCDTTMTGAASGTVTITSITNPGSASGSFQLQFGPDGGSGALTGTFNAAYCDLPTNTNDAGPSTCE